MIEILDELRGRLGVVEATDAAGFAARMAASGDWPVKNILRRGIA